MSKKRLRVYLAHMRQNPAPTPNNTDVLDQCTQLGRTFANAQN
jgi:hypothetical protein